MTWCIARLEDSSDTHFQPLLPGVPREVSIDGMHKILLSFGLKAKAHETLAPAIWSKRTSPEKMAAIVARGISRLKEALTTGVWEALAPVVHDVMLERVEKLGVSKADRDLARRLRRDVFGLESLGDPVLRYRSRGQLELFLKDA